MVGEHMDIWCACMCHHRGDIPDWTSEPAEKADEDDSEELPTFLNEDASELSVLTDGGDETES